VRVKGGKRMEELREGLRVGQLGRVKGGGEMGQG
jgi:hypothetical protein